MDSHGRRRHAESSGEDSDGNSPLSGAKYIPSLSTFRPPCSSDDCRAVFEPPFRFDGVPFSWEYSPGIPKEQKPDVVDHSPVNHLPLPPSIATPSPRKVKFEDKKRDSSGDEEAGEDPFFAALIECSKPDDGLHGSEIWSNPKVVSTSISDRLGLISLYCSCKRTVQVSASRVYLPKSTANSLHQTASENRLCSFK